MRAVADMGSPSSLPPRQSQALLSAISWAVVTRWSSVSCTSSAWTHGQASELRLDDACPRRTGAATLANARKIERAIPLPSCRSEADDASQLRSMSTRTAAETHSFYAREKLMHTRKKAQLAMHPTPRSLSLALALASAFSLARHTATKRTCIFCMHLGRTNTRDAVMSTT